MTIYPVLLSGGSGTRLWPLSRASYPKQFLRLLPSQTNTLLQNTALRLAGRGGYADPIIICSNAHRFIVTEQFDACGCTARKIYLEPVGRNTAPAVTVAALSIVEEDPEGIMVVMPSDHIMDDPAAFSRRVDDAVEVARGGKFVLFGIVPSEPHTSFGYIQRGAALEGKCNGAYDVASFVEKPDAETAGRLIESSDHYWNSGIFVLPAGALLAEIERLQPELLRACKEAYENIREDLGFFRLEDGAFSESPEISLDHAVMEHTRYAVVLPLEAGWRDIGSWTSAVRQGYRTDNPALGVRNYKMPPRERFLTPEEYQRLGQTFDNAVRDGVNPYAIAALRVLTLSGARSGEIISLQRRWIDEQVGGARLPDSKTGARFLILPAPAIAIIRDVLDMHDNNFVFPGRSGTKPYGGLKKVWLQMREQAGLDDVRLHDLRHSYASIAVAGGASLFIVGKVLGHNDPATTKRYAHIARCPIKIAADEISLEISGHLLGFQ